MKTRRLIITALFVAVGLLLPQLFHMVAGKAGGASFLPMHIPVFLAGLLAGPVSGAAVGVLSPLLSTVLTGMPTFEKLPFMALELVTYGVVAGLLFTRCRANVYLSLLTAMLAGRIVNLAAYFVAGSLLHMQGYSWMMAIQSVAVGVPGILIQVIALPVIVLACKKVVSLHGKNG